MPSLFEAYITNLGKYNEGELVGETLKFPTSPHISGWTAYGTRNFSLPALTAMCWGSIMEQMKATEGVTEELKRTSQMEWVQRCNNIHNRAEEIILHEMIYA